MFTELGFIGTRAPVYLDIVGLFFIFLPLALLISIRFAQKGEVEKHVKSQGAIFGMTLIMVVVFEVGMRLAGGFSEYIRYSLVSRDFFISFFILHIIVAVLTFLLWLYQIIFSYKLYKNGELIGENLNKHKKIAKFLIMGILVTVMQGAFIYYYLFIS